MELIDIVGKRFGRLAVVERAAENTKLGQARWLCKCDCGTEKIIDGANLRYGHTKSCGCYQREAFAKIRLHAFGKDNPCWKGGYRGKDKNGYIIIYIFPDNPYFSMANHVRHIKEHRLKMAQHIGRALESWEIVHHINGIKDDNRIKNLELCPHQADHMVIERLIKENKKLKEEISRLKGAKNEYAENDTKFQKNTRAKPFIR